MASADYYFYFLSTSFPFPLSHIPSYLPSYPQSPFRILFLSFFTVCPLFNICPQFHLLNEAFHSTFSDVIINVSSMILDRVTKWLFFFQYTLQNYTSTWVFSPSEYSPVELNILNIFVTYWLLEYIAYGFRYVQGWQIIIFLSYIWLVKTDRVNQVSENNISSQKQGVKENLV